MYIYVLIESKYIIGGIAVFLLGISAFYLAKLSSQSMDESLEKIVKKKQSMTQWSHEYFTAYREISLIWGKVVKTKKWFEKFLSDYTNARLQTTKIIFAKDLFVQLLVEMPFVLLMCLVIFGVYHQDISLSQAVIWLGLSQYMLTASQDLARNSIIKSYRKDCQERLKEIKALLNNKVPQPTINLSPIKFNRLEFGLLNGVNIKLSLNPRVYRISAANGSGKTTLLNTILSYCRDSPYDNLNMDILKTCLQGNNIRIIDSNAVVFSVLNTIDDQILGFNLDKNNITVNVEYYINHHLQMSVKPDLIKSWLQQLKILRSKFEKSNYKLSLGERVILSCLRNWVCWNSNIKLLIVDECDSCLDQTNKKLFLQTLNQLSQQVAIYIVSHSQSYLLETQLKVDTSNIRAVH